MHNDADKGVVENGAEILDTIGIQNIQLPIARILELRWLRDIVVDANEGESQRWCSLSKRRGHKGLR